MVRRILFAGLLLGPLVVVLHYVADLDETAEFVLAAVALIPLAWLIGEATEHAAEHTGPGIGGFLNATFGNAPELIIALLAVNEGLTEVVRGSLTGSVVGNLLLALVMLWVGDAAFAAGPASRCSLGRAASSTAGRASCRSASSRSPWRCSSCRRSPPGTATPTATRSSH